jgi:hypothetical protein
MTDRGLHDGPVVQYIPSEPVHDSMVHLLGSEVGDREEIEFKDVQKMDRTVRALTCSRFAFQRLVSIVSRECTWIFI